MNDLVNNLREEIKELYRQHKYLLFHGWHHIYFVTEHAKRFAGMIDADVHLVEAAALVHDLNYIVEKNSKPEAAQEMRSDVLSSAGFSQGLIDRIESMINEAHTGSRSKTISPEGMALSDADTLFKALPLTPILFAGKYVQETGTNINELAEKIVSEQRPLLDQDIYFLY